jgi:hypothetical protein
MPVTSMVSVSSDWYGWRSTLRPAGPGRIALTFPMNSSNRPSPVACFTLAPQLRREGAVPRSTWPMKSMRWSKERPWKASMPEPSNRQRGTFRSCSSGCGLRRSATHWAPASTQLTHSFAAAMPEPTMM